MIKRGTALWIALGVGAAVLAVFFGWVLFVPVADWLARHDIGNTSGTSLETARNNARGNLLALTAGIAGFGALIFTARNFALQRRALMLSQRTFEENSELARRTLELTQQGQQRTLELTEQGQVTDRYTKAIEQIGSDRLDVRLGAIYALERIMIDSARDHPTIVEVLAAVVREHAPAAAPGPDPDGGRQPGQHPPLATDVQAAVTVLGRRPVGRTERGPVNLAAANLSRANLSRANLTGADLTGADLKGADLTGADLSGANLFHAHLNGAKLMNAHLNGAQLFYADLIGAYLWGAHLNDANLPNANLTDAQLGGADLTGARMISARLNGADLTGANLTDAGLSGADLTGADLTGVTLTDRQRRAVRGLPADES